MSQENFIRNIMSASTAADSTLSHTARMLITAQAAYESGWGKSRQAQKAFNFFNITQGSWPIERTIEGSGDLEFQPGKVEAVKTKPRWRAYASPADAVTDFLNLLRLGRYVNYREAYAQLRAGDLEYARTLGVLVGGKTSPAQLADSRPDARGYYTLDRNVYFTEMGKVFASVQALVAKMQLSGLQLQRQS